MILLIFMYILSANGFVIPLGCWIAAWIYAAVAYICKLCKVGLDYTKRNNKDN